MNLTRLRTTAPLAGAGMAALALTGCHVNDGASASSNSSPSRSRTVASAGPASQHHVVKSHGSGDIADAGTGDTPACMAAELRADLQIQTSNSEAKGIGTLILTNRSRHRCRVPAGWAPIGTGGPHEYTAFPATRTSYPDRGRPLTLRAGHSAYAAMRWHTAADCGNTSGLGVAWHSSWIPLRYHPLNGRKAPICDVLVLGTLQPKAVNFT
jgi:Protein of unknown function (DUF4232)